MNATVDVPDRYAPILGRFERLRACKKPLTWQARCPVAERHANGDRRPSLILWVGRTGCLCARCLARGCDWREIVRAVGTDERDWFPAKEHQRRRIMSEQRKIEATYDYRGDGEEGVRYQVVRWSPKGFAQRRPVEGGWAWGLSAGRYRKAGPDSWVLASANDPPRPTDLELPDVNLVLYRLPELLADKLQPVIVVEGEKDVEALRRLGLVATCNPGGAGRWLYHYGRWLRGRRVAVIPDNDEPGQLHAMLAAGNCLFWGAASVRIVHLPGIGEKGDVSDWLADRPPTATSQMQRQALCDFIRAAPEYRLSAAPAAKAAKAA